MATLGKKYSLQQPCVGRALEWRSFGKAQDINEKNVLLKISWETEKKVASYITEQELVRIPGVYPPTLNL